MVLMVKKTVTYFFSSHFRKSLFSKEKGKKESTIQGCPSSNRRAISPEGCFGRVWSEAEYPGKPLCARMCC